MAVAERGGGCEWQAPGLLQDPHVSPSALLPGHLSWGLRSYGPETGPLASGGFHLVGGLGGGAGPAPRTHTDKAFLLLLKQLTKDWSEPERQQVLGCFSTRAGDATVFRGLACSAVLVLALRTTVVLSQ